MRAIVLSGGGARGAYEAGVWKALRRLHISYDIVTGTSIGAINGALMVQKEFHRCISIWRNVDFSMMYDEFTTSKNKKDIYLNYLDKVLKGQTDTVKIEQLVDMVYKPRKLYASPINYGIVTFNTTTKRVLYATKENTKKERLKDYIIASASCFPVFPMKKIDNESFIDGGYYDNLPINLAIDLGATEIIAVDLGSIGFKHRIKSKDVKVTYIEPTQKLDSFLMFEKNVANRMIALGYNDTMKVFHKYEGKLYTFKKGSLPNLYEKYCQKFENLVEKYASEMSITKNWKDNKEYQFYKFLEEVMEMMEMDITKVYNSHTVITSMTSLLKKTEDVQITSFDIEELKKLFNHRVMIKYIYNKVQKKESINSAIFHFFKREVAAALFLISVGS